MCSASTIVPSENDRLCEGCGYILNGLADDSRCPECGKPIPESIGPGVRARPTWEGDGPAAKRFIRTTFQVLFRPAGFFKRMSTRGRGSGGWGFALVHRAIASTMLGVAAYVHLRWLWHAELWQSLPGAVLLPGLVVGAYAMFLMTALFTTKLSAWEAAYRGLRLPKAVIKRCLYYHTAHYFPVALLGLLAVLGYHAAERARLYSFSTGQAYELMVSYMIVLCGEVVLGAWYLFRTYWIGMRNVMYANQ